MKAALTRYRVLAYTTGVFLLLLTLHVLVQWYQSSSEGIAFADALGLGRWIPGAEHWVPITHGYLYLVYVVVAVDLWFRTRLPFAGMVLVVLAGTVPVHVVRRRAMGDPPGGAHDRPAGVAGGRIAANADPA